MRAAIYARVSTPRQARDQNTHQQVARLERYAERQGWATEGGRVYLDEGYSGASLNRPGLDALRVTADADRNLTAEGMFGEVSVADESSTCVMVPKKTENALRFSARLADGAPEVRFERAVAG
jgi:hypothetical protein